MATLRSITFEGEPYEAPLVQAVGVDLPADLMAGFRCLTDGPGLLPAGLRRRRQPLPLDQRYPLRDLSVRHSLFDDPQLV